MKFKFAIVFTLFATFAGILYAQKPVKVEQIIAQDSLKTVLYNNLIEGYEKSSARIVIKSNKTQQSCPVFLDEEGFMFLIKIEDTFICIVDIDMD